MSLLHWKGLFLTSPIYCKWSHYFYTVRGGKRKETCSCDSLIVLKRQDKRPNALCTSYVMCCQTVSTAEYYYYNVGKTNSCLLQ